jgi:SEC-C motif
MARPRGRGRRWDDAAANCTNELDFARSATICPASPAAGGRPAMEACHATARRFRSPPELSRSRVSGGEGYPSETRVGRGDRVVHGDKELLEKLGRNDLCPCGSGRRFQDMLPALRPLRRQRAQALCPRLSVLEGLPEGQLRRAGRACRARAAPRKSAPRCSGAAHERSRAGGQAPFATLRRDMKWCNLQS